MKTQQTTQSPRILGFCKTHIAVATLLTLAIVLFQARPADAQKAAGDDAIFTGTANAKSTPGLPFTIQLTDAKGNVYSVMVTNIAAGDSANVKAGKIRAAFPAQGRAFPFKPVGILNQISIAPMPNKIAITTDPTQEKFDKLGKSIQYLAWFANRGGVSSGLDPDGNPSVVQVGVQTGQLTPVLATVYPSAGESADSVFFELTAQLADDGIDAVYSPDTGTLSLTNALQPYQEFVFGNTDTGLSTSATVANN
jgi:hypothetical protein